MIMQQKHVKVNIIAFLCFFIINSCQKKSGLVLEREPQLKVFVEEAKNWFVNGPVLLEKKILNLPFNVLPKTASIRQLARMEKLGRILNWEEAEINNIHEVQFLIVPVKNRHSFYDTKYEIARSIVFYKVNDEEMNMNIVEVLIEKGSVNLAHKSKEITAIAFLNRIKNRRESVPEVNASVFFYDQNYNSTDKYYFKDGIFDLSNSSLTNKRENIDSNLLSNTMEGEGCQTWYVIYELRNESGEVIYWEILYSYQEGGGCTSVNPDEEQVPEGGGSSETLHQNENVDAVDDICKNSFKFQQVISPTNGLGGWRVAGTRGIHMNIIDLVTKKVVPLVLPTMYFGLPIIRANGEYYSENYAKEIAAEAVEYAETEVMKRYHSLGGTLDIVGMAVYYREKMNEKMVEKGGTATLTPGSNIAIVDLGNASYGWPILGCL
jgi:hypothetical protein